MRRHHILDLLAAVLVLTATTRAAAQPAPIKIEDME